MSAAHRTQACRFALRSYRHGAQSPAVRVSLSRALAGDRQRRASRNSARRGSRARRRQRRAGVGFVASPRSSLHKAHRSRIAHLEMMNPLRCRRCAELDRLRVLGLVTIAVRHIGQNRLAVEQAHGQHSALLPCPRPAGLALPTVTFGETRGRLPVGSVSRREHEFPLVLLLGIVGSWRMASSCPPPASAVDPSTDAGTTRGNPQQVFVF